MCRGAINCDIRYLDNSDNKPIVFIYHGFKGFRDWGFFPYVGKKLAEMGAITVTIDFSMNGIIDREKVLFNIKNFANNTMSTQVKDGNMLLNFLETGNLLGDEKNCDIYILGHSMGGAVAAMVASQNPEINKVALWASISKIDRYTPRQKEIWRRKGKLEFKESQGGQTLELSREYLEDIENLEKEKPFLEIISELNIPLLALTGTQDLTVRPVESEQIASAAKSSLLKKIEKAGHTFGIKHPFTEPTPQLDEAIEITAKFFGIYDNE